VPLNKLFTVFLGYIFLTTCLLKHSIRRKIAGRIEVMGKRGRRYKQLLRVRKQEDATLKEEALDRTLWRTRFGSGHGPVVISDYTMKFFELPGILNCFIRPRMNVTVRWLSPEMWPCKPIGSTVTISHSHPITQTGNVSSCLTALEWDGVPSTCSDLQPVRARLHLQASRPAGYPLGEQTSKEAGWWRQPPYGNCGESSVCCWLTL
jgi:hypothetical protein